MRRRVVTLLLLTCAVVPVGTGVAVADPAVPTNWRSEVVALEPAIDGVRVAVVGGDAFLELEVEPGRRVVVLGYGSGSEDGADSEPYLRVEEDGTVLVNRRSPAAYLNADRYGGQTVPPDATPDAEPRWEILTRGGTYRWHDHRIHWMIRTQLPPGPRERPDERQVTGEWTVPLEVDGEPVQVWGTLTWIPDRPLAPVLLVAVAAIGAAVLAARRFGWPVAPGAALVAGVLATVVAGGDLGGAVESSTGSVLAVVFGGAGVLAAIAALALRSDHPTEADRMVLLSCAFTLVLAGQRLDLLTEPVLPSGLPDVVARFGLALAAGSAAGGVAAWWSGRQRALDPSEAA